MGDTTVIIIDTLVTATHNRNYCEINLTYKSVPAYSTIKNYQDQCQDDKTQHCRQIKSTLPY